MPRVGFEPMIPVFERQKTVKKTASLVLIISSSTMNKRTTQESMQFNMCLLALSAKHLSLQ